MQQNIDCTFRLYDYDRPRELHLDAGLAVARTVTHSDPRDCAVPGSGTVKLVDGPKFHLVRAEGPLAPTDYPATELTVTPLGDGCTVDGEAIAFGECAVTEDGAGITLSSGARALIAWAA